MLAAHGWRIIDFIRLAGIVLAGAYTSTCMVIVQFYHKHVKSHIPPENYKYIIRMCLFGALVGLVGVVVAGELILQRDGSGFTVGSILRVFLFGYGLRTLWPMMKRVRHYYNHPEAMNGQQGREKPLPT
jgi:RsiW-degrading membrane proteinase PrsW (M82 family)